MFTDPHLLVRTYSAMTEDASINLSMPASERASDHSTYRAVDGDQNDHVLFIGHQYGRRNRFTVRYTVSGVSPSLLVPDQNSSFSQSVYVVADVPTSGPIENTVAQTLIFRRQLVALGRFLVSVTGSEPPMRRIVNGET